MPQPRINKGVSTCFKKIEQGRDGVRDEVVAGSNPVIPTYQKPHDYAVFYYSPFLRSRFKRLKCATFVQLFSDFLIFQRKTRRHV